jgi:hypothetical protein
VPSCLARHYVRCAAASRPLPLLGGQTTCEQALLRRSPRLRGAGAIFTATLMRDELSLQDLSDISSYIFIFFMVLVLLDFAIGFLVL